MRYKTGLILLTGFILFIIIGFYSNFALADDIYEENDNFSEAKRIGAGSYNLWSEDLFDFFIIELEEGDYITVTITFSHADADLDLNFHDDNDPSYSLLAYSFSSTLSNGYETISYHINHDGDYFIKVINAGNAYYDIASYYMEVSVTSGGGDDGGDNGGDDGGDNDSSSDSLKFRIPSYYLPLTLIALVGIMILVIHRTQNKIS
ncbi:MAG: PPC domain-containing protein [Promethearchaeota archaeon]